MIVEANAGYRMEEDGSGRVLVQFGDRIKVFHIYVFYARKGFLEKIRRPYAAFWPRGSRPSAICASIVAETIDIVRRTAEVSPGVAARDYDELMGMFNPTGQVRPQGARRAGALLRRDGLAAAGSRHAHAHHQNGGILPGAK